MADIRIKDLATTATTTASDDFMAVDGVTNGTRKLSAAAPAFLTSVTTPSLTSPASTPLTLGTGTSGAAMTVLSASNFVGIGTVTPTKKLDVAGNVEIGFDDAGANEVTKDFTTSHSPTNANASILFGLNDGGANGAAGVKISNSRVGAFNSQFISFLTSEGGVSVTTERMKIEKNGVVSISSTTAGSSGAGALVVTGGLATGAASYFGGAVTGAGAITANNDITTSIGKFATQASGQTVGMQLDGFVNAGSFNNYINNNSSAAGTYAALNFGRATNILYGFLRVNNNTEAMEIGTAATVRLTIASTGAATFAGAVTGGLITSQASDNSSGFVVKRSSNPYIDFYDGGTSGTIRAEINATNDGINGGTLVFAPRNAAGSITTAMTLTKDLAATFAGLIFPQQATTASAPAYVKGAIYFDTTLNKLRVGGATAYETITSV